MWKTQHLMKLIKKFTTTLNLRNCAGIRAIVVDILLAIHCSDDAEGRKRFLRLHTARPQTCAVLLRGNKAFLWSTRLDLHVLFDVAKHRVERLVAGSGQTSLQFSLLPRGVISRSVFFFPMFFWGGKPHPVTQPSLASHRLSNKSLLFSSRFIDS